MVSAMHTIPINHWPLDNVRITDPAGALDGVIHNNARIVPANIMERPIQALSLDGDGQYVSFPGVEHQGQETDDATIGPNWTAALWVRRTGETGSASLLSSEGYALKLEQWGTDGRVGFTHFGVDDHSFDFVCPVDRWVYLVFSGTPEQTTLHVDGTLHGSIDAGIRLPRHWLGCRHGESGFTAADLAELVLFDCVLSPEEIREAVARADLSPDRMAPERMALDFDGEDDCIELADDGQLQLVRDVTVEAWICPRGAQQNWAGIASRIYDTGTVEGGYGLLCTSTGGLQFAVTPRDTKGIIYVKTDNRTLSSDAWHHVVGTYDGETVRIYIDGVEKAEKQVPASGLHHEPGIVMHIGAYIDDNDRIHFRGQIDEVRIWRVARTADALRTTMHTYLDPSEYPELVGYYRFEQGEPSADNRAQTTLADATGRFPGALRGFALTGATSNWVRSSRPLP